MLTSENQAAPPNRGADDHRPISSEAGETGLDGNKLCRALAISRIADLLCHPRHQGSLQTNHSGCCLGRSAACHDHGGLQHLLRQTGRGALRRYSLSRFFLLCAAALATVCLCADAVEQQPGTGCAGAHKGVFSTVDHPVRIGGRRLS